MTSAVMFKKYLFIQQFYEDVLTAEMNNEAV
jgi:hypothetical protein